MFNQFWHTYFWLIIGYFLKHCEQHNWKTRFETFQLKSWTCLLKLWTTIRLGFILILVQGYFTLCVMINHIDRTCWATILDLHFFICLVLTFNQVNNFEIETRMVLISRPVNSSKLKLVFYTQYQLKLSNLQFVWYSRLDHSHVLSFGAHRNISY